MSQKVKSVRCTVGQSVSLFDNILTNSQIGVTYLTIFVKRFAEVSTIMDDVKNSYNTSSQILKDVMSASMENDPAI